MHGFVRGEGAREFLEAFTSVVVPPGGKLPGRDLIPPVLLLAEGEGEGEGERAAARVGRAVRGLRWCLYPEGAKRVPYAMLGADEIREAAGERPLSLGVGRELAADVPRHTGRLRLPDFWLARDIVEWALDPEAPEPDATGLRDHAYAERLKRGLVLRALWALGGQSADGGASAPGWLAHLQRFLAQPLFQLLPRWWWGRRCTRRLLRSRKRGWYAKWRGISHGRTAEEFFGDVARLIRSERCRGREAGVGRFEELLLRALLTDLRRTARPGRISPWRRRRLTRFAVLLELPGEGGGAAAGERFLQRYGAAARDTRCAAVVVVAVAPAEGAAAGERRSLAGVADRLRAASGLPAEPPEPLRAVLPEPPSASPDEVELTPVAPRTFRLAPAAELALTGTLVAALLSVPGVWFFERVTTEEDRTCLGGASREVVTGRAEPSDATPRQEYEEAAQMIDEENARVNQEAGEHGGTVRTVMHIGADVAKNQKGQRYNGAVPELRGIALAQRSLNEEAENNPGKVWLRVATRHAGDDFANAERVARQIVADARKKNSGIIGVVGFSHSLRQTQTAVRILGDARIPMVGTTATADAMQVSDHYRRVAPINSREAGVEAAFAHRGRIVDDGSGNCAPAEAAVVVKDPRDLYSQEIGRLFAERFGGRPTTLAYTPGGRDKSRAQLPSDDRVVVQDSIGELADAVCERITEAPRTVVYWASRAAEFSAFLDDFGDDTACEGRKLTVLAGNDLTTAALSGEYADRPWLRLYHTVHVLPAGHPRASDVAQVFNAEYAHEFGSHDLWRNDGRAALGYDAMQLMAAAVNTAYRSTETVGRSHVQLSLDNGVRKQGASGYLHFGRGDRGVSRDKPLVILRHTADGSRPVLYCGAFARNPAGRIERWGPHGEFDCPRDG
ncbi:hypothetical protein [Streptomyces coffeae]|uniref:ABC transporter substrate-binding protein n=1 Tax=Streptomyces coffeae TaxID=621382 RepID=A0ABS1NDA6_9ACTN|nr:hypothetical protein [Streptomyces coffeae]MBL1098076.1 hypothetical protein [Streptomyces coffeae]